MVVRKVKKSDVPAAARSARLRLTHPIYSLSSPMVIAARANSGHAIPAVALLCDFNFGRRSDGKKGTSITSAVRNLIITAVERLFIDLVPA